ncbi:hypothetical protein NPIL_350071, partial [Nephila pilipes]
QTLENISYEQNKTKYPPRQNRKATWKHPYVTSRNHMCFLHGACKEHSLENHAENQACSPLKLALTLLSDLVLNPWAEWMCRTNAMLRAFSDAGLLR